MDLVKASIIFCVMAVSAAEKLLCPSCTYINTEADVARPVRTVIDTVINTFSKPECSWRLKSPISEIKSETCTPPEGKIAMCSYYDGTVEVEVDIFLASFTIPLRVYQQGCYYALSANPPSVGCHDRENINEDKSTMKRIIDSATSLVDNVLSFKGKLCVCKDSYCKDDTGSGTKITGVIQLLILSQVLAFLFML